MYFEPIVGYGKGSTSLSATTDGSYSTYTSPSVGFKFGYFVDYVYVVTDFRYSIVNLSGLPAGSSQAQTNIGIGLGWDWNIPIRTFLGLDLRVSSNVFGTTLSGGGSRYAIGYYLNMDTLLSLEFIRAALGGDAGSLEIDASYTTTLVTLSFPIEFLYPQTKWKDKVRQ